MKIDKITLNSFKSGINKDNFAHQKLPQKPNPDNTCDKIFYPQGIQYWIEMHKTNTDIFENVQTTALKNNVILNTDKNSPEDKFALRMYIKPTEQQNVNPAVKLLHERMLSNLDNCTDENDNFATFYSANAKMMEISINWDKKDFPKVFEKFIQDFCNLNIDEKALRFEKEFVLNNLDSLQNDEAFNCLYGVEKCSKEDIKNVSSDDIKKFHDNLLSNSMTLCAISCPKGTDETTLKEINDIIEKQIPNQKPYDNKILSKNPLPIAKNEVFYLKSSDDFGKSVSKTYNFQNENTLKDAAISELIGTAIDKIIRKNYSQNIDGLLCYHYTDYLNKHFVIHASANKNADIKEDMINSAIKTITEKPLDGKFFEEVKQSILKSRKEDLNNSIKRTNPLLCGYFDKSGKNNDFAVVLNSITPQELQQSAQICFSSPCITQICE